MAAAEEGGGRERVEDDRGKACAASSADRVHAIAQPNPLIHPSPSPLAHRREGESVCARRALLFLQAGPEHVSASSEWRCMTYGGLAAGFVQGARVSARWRGRAIRMEQGRGREA